MTFSEGYIEKLQQYTYDTHTYDYNILKFYNIVPSDFLNIWTLISWRRLMIGIRFFYEKLSRLNWISLGVIKSENCRTLFFGDRG